MYQVDEEPLCGCATCKSLFIYLSIILFILFLPFKKAKTFFPPIEFLK